jgi:hypothetical protein
VRVRPRDGESLATFVAKEIRARADACDKYQQPTRFPIGMHVFSSWGHVAVPSGGHTSLLGTVTDGDVPGGPGGDTGGGVGSAAHPADKRIAAASGLHIHLIIVRLYHRGGRLQVWPARASADERLGKPLNKASVALGAIGVVVVAVAVAVMRQG